MASLGLAQAPAVLRRGGAPAADGAGRRVRRPAPPRTDSTTILSVLVAVVVDVLEPILALLQQLAHTHLACGHAFVLALLDIELAQEQLRGPIERAAAGGEAPQVAVRPVEGRLQHLVHVLQGQLRAQLEPSPDRRGRAAQIDPDREHLRGGRRTSAVIGARRAECRTVRCAHQVIEQGVELIGLETCGDLAEAGEVLGLGVVGGGHGAIVGDVRRACCSRRPPAARVRSPGSITSAR